MSYEPTTIASPLPARRVPRPFEIDAAEWWPFEGGPEQIDHGYPAMAVAKPSQLIG